MKQHDIRAKQARKFRPVTTDSKHAMPVVENLLDRQFTVDRPDTGWVGDITYIRTRQCGCIWRWYWIYSRAWWWAGRWVGTCPATCPCGGSRWPWAAATCLLGPCSTRIAAANTPGGGLPRPAQGPWEHEPQGGVLRQRGGGELLWTCPGLVDTPKYREHGSSTF